MTAGPPAAPPGGASGLAPGSVLRLRESLAWQEVAGEVVVLDLAGMVLRGLNRSGGRVFGLLDGRRTLADVAGVIAARYGIDGERALADVLDFAAGLLRRGLLEEIGGTAPAPAPAAR